MSKLLERHEKKICIFTLACYQMLLRVFLSFVLLSIVTMKSAAARWFNDQEQTKKSAQLDSYKVDAMEGVGLDEKLQAQLPLQASFKESNGEAVSLGQIVAGDKPVLLTFNYSDCPMLCSVQLDGFIKGLSDIDFKLGRDYKIITLAIDPHEDPKRTAAFKQKYTQQLGQTEAADSWHFLLGTKEQTELVAGSVGYHYKYVADRDEWSHVPVVTVLTPEGVVSRYLYGVLYEPRHLKLAILEAAQGTIGTTVDRILMYCFHYDAATGRYAPLASRLMQLGGLLTLLIFGFLWGLLWLRDIYRKAPLTTKVG